MTTDRLPQPADDGCAGKPKSTQEGNNTQRPRKKPGVPNVDEILQQLMQLNGAVLIGTMSAKQADLIHKNLRTVLQVQLKRATRDDAGPASQEGLVELCRKDPQILNAIEPFLSQQQVEWLVNEVTDDRDEPI